MKITKKSFDTTSSGEPVESYILENDKGTRAEVLTFGGTLRSFTVDGTDIITGYDNVKDYENGDTYMGALIGRVGNRIDSGKFEIDGTVYQVPVNDGPNSLHGGTVGFDRKIWDAIIKDDALELKLLSPDGDQGYPGNLEVTAEYRLGDDDTLTIELDAKTDKATPVNLTSHTYFNLNGGGTIEDHDLEIYGDRYTETDENLLPTGQILPVEGTALDFTKAKPIREALIRESETPIQYGNGVDHNFIFKDEYDSEIIPLAKLAGDHLALTILSDQPGMQVYSGNFLNETGKGGQHYGQYGAIAMEPQNWPDSVNQPDFPEMILQPDEDYHRRIIYQIERV